MHQEAMINGALFFKTYLEPLGKVSIVEIGSQNVNGSLREVAPNNSNYIGVDFCKANGVDVVLDDPYKLPFSDNCFDAVVSSSCFEHSEMFWILYLEIIRILKPDGIFYLNAPSAGGYHRYPVDCYRFYPDSGVALSNWARRNGYNTAVIEHYTHHNDYVCVTIKNEKHISKYQNKILDTFSDVAFACKYPDYDSLLFPKDSRTDNAVHAPHLNTPGAS